MPLQRLLLRDLITKRLASVIKSTIPSAASLETLLVLRKILGSRKQEKHTPSKYTRCGV